MGRRLVAFGLPLLIAVPAAVSLRAVHGGPKPVDFSEVAQGGDQRHRRRRRSATLPRRRGLEPGRPPAPRRATPSSTSTSRGGRRNYGLTELFSESSEPPFDEFPLEQFKELFPEGSYTFRGTTIDGTPMAGTATVTHDFPDAPEILSPVAGSRVRRDQVVVEWSPVTTPRVSTLTATRSSWSKKSPCCGYSAPIWQRRRHPCRFPSSSSSRAPSTRSRSSPSRPAATKPSPSSPSAADKPRPRICSPVAGAAHSTSLGPRRGPLELTQTPRPNDAHDLVVSGTDPHLLVDGWVLTSRARACGCYGVLSLGVSGHRGRG